jgi:hypothetical protein
MITVSRTMTTALFTRLEAAALALLEEQAQQVAQWQGLHLAFGRATEAAARNDLDGVRRWLDAACDLEYDATGSADTLGRILDELDLTPHEEG